MMGSENYQDSPASNSLLPRGIPRGRGPQGARPKELDNRMSAEKVARTVEFFWLARICILLSMARYLLRSPLYRCHDCMLRRGSTPNLNRPTDRSLLKMQCYYPTFELKYAKMHRCAVCSHANFPYVQVGPPKCKPRAAPVAS